MNILLLSISGVSLVLFIVNIALLDRFYQRLAAAAVLPALNTVLLEIALQTDFRYLIRFSDDVRFLSDISAFIFVETAFFIFFTVRYLDKKRLKPCRFHWVSLLPQLPVPLFFFYLQRVALVEVQGGQGGYMFLSISINLMLTAFILSFSQLLRRWIKKHPFLNWHRLIEFKFQGFWVILVMAHLLPLELKSAIGTQLNRPLSHTGALVLLFLAVMASGYTISRFNLKSTASTLLLKKKTGLLPGRSN